MRKVVFVFLAAAVMLSFGTYAAAADVSVTGSYYVEGIYESNHSLEKDCGKSTAFYAQRLRITPVFQVVDGLTLTTRFDALSRVWEGADVVNPAFPDYNPDERNIAWKWAYVTFMTRFGKFDVGYQRGYNVWGTSFGDTEISLPRIKFTTTFGDFAFIGVVEKQAEGSIGSGQADADMDNYIVATVYKKDDFQGGMLYKFIINNTGSAGPFGTKVKANIVSPYFKANIGKAYVEGQIYYLWGELKTEETPIPPLYDNRNINSYAGYLMGKYNIGPGYVGAMYAYVQGDDPETDDLEGVNGFGGGADWNPCLILWNSELNKWMGDTGFDPGSTTNYEMLNASLYQLFAGASPVEKLSVSASYTFARANEKQGRLDADYGQEVDLTATYKIYDNLDYMVGFGYLITGDFYKGASDINQTDDDYLLLNKLTLNF